MIKPIFSPNAKNNMSEIIPILLASKCRVLYFVKDEAGYMVQAFLAAKAALKNDDARVIDYARPHWSFVLPNGSSLRICRESKAANYLKVDRYSAIYVQAHKHESPELSHDEFVQIATEHLSESRKSLQERLVATGALEPGAVLPTLLTKQAG